MDALKKEYFDLAIFASGYEGRASYLAKNIDLSRVSKSIALGFAEHRTVTTRLENDTFYISQGVEIVIVNTMDEKPIYDTLISAFEEFNSKRSIRVLVDYTSMSRLWYSGILHFLRLQEKEISVVLNYSLGKYEKKFRDISYTSVRSLPSHEGSLSSNDKTLLVLAIGFSPHMIKSVIEEIEPNEIVGILPVESSYNDFSSLIRDDLTKDIDYWINCPIDDLESIFRKYAEITNNNLHSKDLIFLSLGPKIFTIASILVSQRFDQVTCLYLKYVSNRNSDVPASGEVICSKIFYQECD